MSDPPSEESPSGESPSGESPPPAWKGQLLRLAGLAVGIWGGVILAAIGAFLTPLRIGGVLVPIAVVIVIAGNLLLIRFTYDVTDHKWLSLIPGGVWLAITLAVSNRTNEGDLVLAQSNWVATVYLFAGSISIGIAAYRMINPRRR